MATGSTGEYLIDYSFVRSLQQYYKISIELGMKIKRLLSEKWCNYSLNGPDASHVLCRIWPWPYLILTSAGVFTNYSENIFIIYHFIPLLKGLSIGPGILQKGEVVDMWNRIMKYSLTLVPNVNNT